MSWSGYGQGQGYNPQSQGPPPVQYGQRPPLGAPPGGYQQYGQTPAGYQPYGQSPHGQGYNSHGSVPAQYGHSTGPSGGYQQQQQFRPAGPQGGYSAAYGYGGAPPPPSYGPPPGVDPTVWSWFQAVDADHSGKISAMELQQALNNNNWSHFNPETCRLMIGLFDRDRSGTIDIHEFAALWKYVQDWKTCFDGFDRDRSGTIDATELNTAFRAFGYNLTPQFCQLCVRVFDRAHTQTMKLDDFIQCCVMLKTLTDKFKSKDSQMKGMININYEEFLEMVLDTTLSKV